MDGPDKSCPQEAALKLNFERWLGFLHPEMVKKGILQSRHSRAEAWKQEDVGWGDRLFFVTGAKGWVWNPEGLSPSR